MGLSISEQTKLGLQISTSHLEQSFRILPDFIGEGIPSLYPHAVPYFQPDIYNTNFKFLQQLFPDDTHKEQIIHLFPGINANIQNTIDFMTQLKNSWTIRQELELLQIPHVQSGWAEQYKHITDWIPYILHKNDPHILISSDHGTDAALFHFFEKEAIDLSKIGIIVFDTHLDFSDSSDKNATDFIAKHSFLDYLLSRGLGHVHIIGSNPETTREIHTGLVETENGTVRLVDLVAPKSHVEEYKLSGIDYYNRRIFQMRQAYINLHNQERLSIGHDEGPRTPLQERYRQLTTTINHMKRQGITQIFLSIDLDVLDMQREKITATEYNPFAEILAVGLNKLEDVLALHKQPIQSPKQALALLVAHTLRSTYKNNVCGLIHNDNGYLSLDEICSLIGFINHLCRSLDLPTYVQTPYGNVYGTINEAIGYDYNSLTLQAIYKIAQAIHS